MDAPIGLTLQLGGVAPNVIRELSGIYPTFVSAFKELVSNAYDADAILVTIRFSSDLSTVTVEDNGAGMTPFEFQDEYLRIGGSVQGRGEDMTARGRRPIGRKGIGFLAVARYCRQVEIHSHADRVVTFCESVVLEPQSSLPKPRRIPFFQGTFAHALASFTTVQAVRCEPAELTPAEYRQDGLTVELSPEVWRKFRGQSLIVQYAVDCRAVDLQATIDYDYLLSLEDNHNLEMLQDFCHIRLVPGAGATKPPSTRVTLHLREFVQRELQAPQRRGRVRNVASASGLDRFLWHLSRSVPVSYELSSQELERYGLEALAITISPTPFVIRVMDIANGPRELKRPLLGDMNVAALDSAALVRQPVRIESDGLAAQGYLFGFPQPIFPAELRGIAIRVRGVEIGKPDFLGVENDLPVKYRPFLSQVMGEIIVTEGLDAINAIMPGREGFYAENGQFQALRRHLVGDGTVELGVLGQVLQQLWKQRSVESSVARIVQEARRRGEAFLDVSQAITALSIGSRYGRALRRLFARSDVVANGLCHVPKYQIQLPGTIGDYALELSDLTEGDYQLDTEHNVVRLSRDAKMWDSSLYILGRDFDISLRSGGPGDPVCEIDFSANTIYLNWLHPTRSKMGDAMFVKSALFWRIAYLAANGDVDMMMDLAHRLLSFSA
ncbi:MAG TPA: hypothetical protein EYP49_19630 [Anaerolineae bacterium]|nr:hypothetical protein [Anaerolineae bacterium]